MVDLDALRPRGRQGLEAILADPRGALVAFDYDGTLSPIVDDPATAYALPGIIEAVAGLAAEVGQVAVITGRPARTAVELAGLRGAAGLDRLVVLGQYGFERWSPAAGDVTTVDPPAGLTQAQAEIPALLESAGVTGAVLEDKGLAVAVHVRRAPDPAAAFAAMRDPLLDLAVRSGLAAEPGRYVIELRPPGMDKGKALLALAEEAGARSRMFTGDDLGDLAAFDAVDTWRTLGHPGLLVCSGSDEVAELADRADVVVDGPPGVLDLVVTLTSRLT
jgi:trehalose 6-phosphate phosphatase